MDTLTEPHSQLLTEPLQQDLLTSDEPVGIDRSFRTARRQLLDGGAWLDIVPGWVSGPDRLFDDVLRAGMWAEHEMVMYEQVVVQPRLQTSWHLGELPAELNLLRGMSAALADRYRTALPRVSANLYRSGHDAVAWHGDQVARDLPEAVVAVVSLGQPRLFRLRPRAGGASVALVPGRGDLVVMGGSCQRTWQHTVPRVRSAGPRISLMFRESYSAFDIERAEAGRRARRNDVRTQ